MKINPTSAYQAYNKAKKYSRTPRQAEDTAQRSAHTDQIQFSPEGVRKAEVDQLTKTILADTQPSTSPERLALLRTAVQNGTYHVPTEQLTAAVMKHWVMA